MMYKEFTPSLKQLILRSEQLFLETYFSFISCKDLCNSQEGSLIYLSILLLQLRFG